MSYLGKQFVTGNSTVKGLKVGTILEVTGPSQLTVVDLPQTELQVGDRFESKYGPATVVGLTSRASGVVGNFDPSSQVLYIADGTNKVRFAARFQD